MTQAMCPPAIGRYLVYFDGMTDCVTAEQFADHDWHAMWSGPHLTDADLEQASDNLHLEPLTGELDVVKSIGWHLAIANHASFPGPDARYCVSTHGFNVVCGLHARHHADAPYELQQRVRRSLYPCHNARVSLSDTVRFLSSPICDVKEATQMVGKRAYCDRCAPQALAGLLLASYVRARAVDTAYGRVLQRLARKRK